MLKRVCEMLFMIIGYYQLLIQKRIESRIAYFLIIARTKYSLCTCFSRLSMYVRCKRVFCVDTCLDHGCVYSVFFVCLFRYVCHLK